LTLTGQYTIGRGTRQGRLTIHAQISPEWHVFSTTQKAGGEQATRIVVESSGQMC
jgi:hypothetical protein